MNVVIDIQIETVLSETLVHNITKQKCAEDLSSSTTFKKLHNAVKN